MRSPFKFLDSYSLKDKDAFFGRKKETDVFYELVNKNRLVLVYAPIRLTIILSQLTFFVLTDLKNHPFAVSKY